MSLISKMFTNIPILLASPCLSWKNIAALVVVVNGNKWLAITAASYLTVKLMYFTVMGASMLAAHCYTYTYVYDSMMSPIPKNIHLKPNLDDVRYWYNPENTFKNYEGDSQEKFLKFKSPRLSPLKDIAVFFILKYQPKNFRVNKPDDAGDRRVVRNPIIARAFENYVRFLMKRNVWSPERALKAIVSNENAAIWIYDDESSAFINRNKNLVHLRDVYYYAAASELRYLYNYKFDV